VSAYDANNAWAVGAYDDSNSIQHDLIEHWDGTSWSEQTGVNPGANGNYLYGVKAFSATNVWAVGSYVDADYTPHVLIEHTTDGGNTWTQDSPSLSSGSYGQAIDGDISTGDAWIVGQEYNPQNGSLKALTLQLVNGHFTQQSNISNNSNIVLYSISERSSSDVWAVGIHVGYYTSSPNTTFAMHFNGSSWTEYSSPNPSTEGNYFFGVTTIGSDNVWAAGEAGSSGFLTHWNGSSWSTTIVDTSEALYSIASTTSNNIWAAGISNNSSSWPFIYQSSDGGSTWTQSTTEVPSGQGYFWGITFDKNSGNGWAVGVANVNPASAQNTTLIEQYTPPRAFSYPVDLSQIAWHNDYDVHTPIYDKMNLCYNVAYNIPYHTGQDYGFPATLIKGKWVNNTPIYAVADGVVLYSSKKDPVTESSGGTTSYPGGVVIIQHTLSDGTNIWSMYAHLDPDKILVGASSKTTVVKVTKGQKIADGLIQQVTVDKQGNLLFDNTHLHWEMRYFYDGSGIKQAPNYQSTCAGIPGPGYSYNTNDALAHPDNFQAVVGKNKDGTLIYQTYHWTNPAQFVATH